MGWVGGFTAGMIAALRQDISPKSGFLNALTAQSEQLLLLL